MISNRCERTCTDQNNTAPTPTTNNSVNNTNNSVNTTTSTQTKPDIFASISKYKWYIVIAIVILIIVILIIKKK